MMYKIHKTSHNKLKCLAIELSQHVVCLYINAKCHGLLKYYLLHGIKKEGKCFKG